MAIKPSSAKAKGRKLQNWVRDKILATFPSLDPSDVLSTSMGAGGEDVKLSAAARNHFAYSVECKSLKAIAVYKHHDQAANNCPAGAEPLVVLKANRRRPLVLIDAEHFFNLFRK
jgi:hypothetical protein